MTARCYLPPVALERPFLPRMAIELALLELGLQELPGRERLPGSSSDEVLSAFGRRGCAG